MKRGQKTLNANMIVLELFVQRMRFCSDRQCGSRTCEGERIYYISAFEIDRKCT